MNLSIPSEILLNFNSWYFLSFILKIYASNQKSLYILNWSIQSEIMLHTEFRHSVRNRVTYRNMASSKKSRYIITVHTELKHPVRNHVTYWIGYCYPEGPGVCITTIIGDRSLFPYGSAPVFRTSPKINISNNK